MKKAIFGILLCSSVLHAQLGVGTPTPQETLHINGTLQVTDGIYVGGNATTKGSSGEWGQVLQSNGPNKAPSWGELAKVPETEGTVIIVNGAFTVAQEITVQMSADFTNGSTTGGPPAIIGNLTNVIIDNTSSYRGTRTNNSFKVEADALYQIKMNIQIATDRGASPVIGVWDNTLEKWVARVNDYFDLPFEEFQTYTLIAAIPLLTTHIYSFRAANTSSFMIRHLSRGETGAGPVSQVSVKRLR
ncbi:hypothetical protein [Flavobacterium hercynium]|uniref:Uncharacterized protein n=1 Tax=Flavobacterium hercynium TaxID=387094 RepID=A0A226HGB2_9FLAO|nr:hypothetical protein [Flavobacterium hercynium]OXA93144.1 hypothetical protein B0A66_07670 [Flavobacterium hercynium]SMP32750.1 hypothetical protein SAMN06265346_11581 [Flavobacterium hercynium]